MSSLAGDTTEQTRLWKIIRKMPKGALLHAHLDAMVDVDYILEVLLNTPGIHIWCEDSHLATAEAREAAPIVVRFKEKEHREGSIWREDYVPGTPILFSQAADDYPGGRDEFLKWLKTRCTVSETATVSQRHELSTFIGNFLYYEPVFRAFLRRLMSTLYADGISWVELRYAPPPFSHSPIGALIFPRRANTGSTSPRLKVHPAPELLPQGHLDARDRP